MSLILRELCKLPKAKLNPLTGIATDKARPSRTTSKPPGRLRAVPAPASLLDLEVYSTRVAAHLPPAAAVLPPLAIATPVLLRPQPQAALGAVVATADMEEGRRHLLVHQAHTLRVLRMDTTFQQRLLFSSRVLLRQTCKDLSEREDVGALLV